jgi:protein PET100
MGGPNLELFRFGFYLFFPVVALFHYGNPDWYTKHVVPVCSDTCSITY